MPVYSNDYLGRGAYYKNKYGGGAKRSSGEYASREGSRNRGGASQYAEAANAAGIDLSQAREMMPLENLRNLLTRLDGKQYGAYKDLYSRSILFILLISITNKSVDKSFLFDKPLFELYALSIQGDSFAPPSTFCVEVPLDEYVTNLPAEVYKTPHR